MQELAFRDVIRETLREEMRRDNSVFIMGTDVGPYGGEFRVSGDLYEEFGDKRAKDTPISEQGIIGVCLGAAVTGLRPVAEIPFNDFITMSMDQIVNQAAKFRYTFGGQVSVPMVIRTAIGGYIRAAEQHSQCFEAWFVHVPGLKVVAPSTHDDARGLLITAIRDDDPVIFIEHKFLYPLKSQTDSKTGPIPLGKADIKRQGKDITLISYSYLVHKCISVADKLKKEGISVEVIDIRSLFPLDKDTIIESVKKTSRAVIAHEAHTRGGFGGELAAVIAEEAFEYLDSPVKRIGAKDAPIPFPSVLEDRVLPQEEDIEKTIKDVLKG